MSLSDLIETFILSAALSIDVFIASVSYGSQGIKVPFVSVMVISGVCSAVLTLSVGLGRLLSPFVTPAAAGGICFAILFVMGFLRVFDTALKAWIKRSKGKVRKVRFSAFKLHFLLEVYAEPEIADLDSGGVLSAGEAALLAAAMSLDGGAAGLGAGAGNAPVALTGVLSFVLGVVAVWLGMHLGRMIARKIPFDLSPAGGILLIVLAFLKL